MSDGGRPGIGRDSLYFLETGRPLMLEELRASASSTALTFRMTATKAPKRASQNAER